MDTLYSIFRVAATRFLSNIAIVYSEQCGSCRRANANSSKTFSAPYANSMPSTRSANKCGVDKKIEVNGTCECSCEKESKKISYFDLLNSSEKVGSVLKGHCNSGEIIGYCSSINLSTPACLIGILSIKCGFAFCQSKDDTDLLLKRLGVRHIVCCKANVRMLLDFSSYPVYPVTSFCTSQTEYVLLSVEHSIPETRVPGIAYVVMTSGSTGQPKVVSVPHECIVPNVIELSHLFSMHENDRVLWTSPLTFDPSIVELFTTLSVGASLLIVPSDIKVMTRRLESLLCHMGVSVLMATPSLAYGLDNISLRDGIFGPLSQLRTLVLGGEMCPPKSVLRKWISHRSIEIYNIYGITELSCWATCHQVTDSDLVSEAPVPIGQPLTGVLCEVLDETGGTVTANGTGVLYIGSNSRFCYVDNELTHSQFPVMRCTGDMVCRVGDSIVYEGRIDDQVKRHGQRMNLLRLQQTMLQVTAVQAAAAVMMNDRLFMAVIGCDQAVARQHIKQQLPPCYDPDIIVEVGEIPVTRHGKLDKEKLRGLARDSQAQTMCRSISCLWMEVLGTDTPPIDSSYFVESGGTSFLAVQLADRISNAYSLNSPLVLDTVLHSPYCTLKKFVEERSRVTSVGHVSCVGPDNTVIQRDNLEKCNKDVIVNGDVKAKLKDSEIFRKPDQDDLYGVDSGSNMSQTENEKTVSSELAQLHSCTTLENTVISFDGCKRIKSIVNSDTSSVFPGKIPRLHKKDILPHSVWSMRRSSQVICHSVAIGDEDSRPCYCPRLSLSDAKVGRGEACKNCYGDSCEKFGHVSRQTDESSLNLYLMWTYNTGKCVDASPLVVHCGCGRVTLCIGSHSHQFVALDVATGLLLWKQNLPGRIESSACLSVCGQFVVVGCYDGCVYSMCLSTGDIWWAFCTGAAVKSSPVTDTTSGLVYVGSHDQHIYALDVKNRSVRWSHDLQKGSVFASPCVSYQPYQLYVATLGGCLFSLHPASGSVLWENCVGKPFFSSPVCSVSNVVVGCVDSYVYCFTHSGQLVWKFQTRSPIFSSPYLAPDCSVIVGSHDSHVYCVVAGKLMWKTVLDSAVYSSPCLVKCSDFDQSVDFESHRRCVNYADVGNLKYRMEYANQCLDKSGQLMQYEGLTNHCPESRAREWRKGCICACSSKGTIYLLSLSNGLVITSSSVGAELFSSPVACDNQVFVGCRNDHVYCYKCLPS